MSTFDLIENDPYYKELSRLTLLTGLNPAERVLFLSAFESWYCFLDRDLYLSIASKAVRALEEVACEKC